MSDQPVRLERRITLPFLVLYGVGTMVGGGFYALVGKVAAAAGTAAPLAMAGAGVFALIAGASFAELASRYPVSAGEVRYVEAGFGRRWLASVTGLLVILTGVVSAAALSVATVGFLGDLVAVPPRATIALLVLALAGVAAWGVQHSVGLVAAITVVEVGALVFVVFAADWSPARALGEWRELVPAASGAEWLGVFSGAFLAIYAFVGFEDMVNMAEEVKDARRVVPLALGISILTTTLLYVLVTLVAVDAIPPELLTTSNTPVAELVDPEGWFARRGLIAVSLLAGVNGALVQIVMASRVAYGMARQGLGPASLRVLSARRRTPVRATALVAAVVLLLALFLPLMTLARWTSAILLLVFGLVNVALWRIKRIDPDRGGAGPRLPLWVPLLGALLCFAILAVQATLVAR